MLSPEQSISGNVVVLKAHPDDEAMILYAARQAASALYVDATNGGAGKAFDGTCPSPC